MTPQVYQIKSQSTEKKDGSGRTVSASEGQEVDSKAYSCSCSGEACEEFGPSHYNIKPVLSSFFTLNFHSEEKELLLESGT